MINKIHIENFKSINNLEIDLGRINLFIGANGSGKSNLLESLVLVSASQSNKLDNEFLFSRGLRITKPELMKSSFTKKTSEKNIKIDIFNDNKIDNYEFANDSKKYTEWTNVKKEEYSLDKFEKIDKSMKKIEKVNIDELELEELSKYINSINDIAKKVLDIDKPFYHHKVRNFIIYSPENTALRNFYKEGQIEPLGINGEGLLSLLKTINNYDDKNYIKTIIESLQLFDWFESIHIPDSLATDEDKVIIKDKYLYQEIDQRSTNEGFLFVLFYITLIVAKETPKSFAIDNIDASLNPKLCTKLMSIIIELSHKYDKQLFLTTHNPAILDGIDLNDKEQKVFATSRNDSGHTQIDEITTADNPLDEDGESLHLSEAFLRGYLGGLPRVF